METKKASLYFFAVVIICVTLACFSYIPGNDSNFDINVHDTYYVIAHTHVYFLLTILYLIPGLIYWLCKNLRLVKTLTVIHTIVTVGGFITYFILYAITKMRDPNNLFDDSMETFNIGIAIIFLLVLMAQPLLLINIVIGLIRSKK